MDTSITSVSSSQMEPPKCPCGLAATCAFSYENQMTQYACRVHDPTLQPSWLHFQPPNFSYTTRVLPQVTWASVHGSLGGQGSAGGSGAWAAGGGGGGGAGYSGAHGGRGGGGGSLSSGSGNSSQ